MTTIPARGQSHQSNQLITGKDSDLVPADCELTKLPWSLGHARSTPQAKARQRRPGRLASILGVAAPDNTPIAVAQGVSGSRGHGVGNHDLLGGKSVSQSSVAPKLHERRPCSNPRC